MNKQAFIIVILIANACSSESEENISNNSEVKLPKTVVEETKTYYPYDYIYGKWAIKDFDHLATNVLMWNFAIPYYEYKSDSTVLNNQLDYQETGKFWIRDSSLYEVWDDTIIYPILKLDSMNLKFITRRSDTFHLKKNYDELRESARIFFEDNKDSIHNSWGIKKR